jgi:hypothetical protein
MQAHRAGLLTSIDEDARALDELIRVLDTCREELHVADERHDRRGGHRELKAKIDRSARST